MSEWVELKENWIQNFHVKKVFAVKSFQVFQKLTFFLFFCLFFHHLTSHLLSSCPLPSCCPPISCSTQNSTELTHMLNSVSPGKLALQASSVIKLSTTVGPRNVFNGILFKPDKLQFDTHILLVQNFCKISMTLMKEKKKKKNCVTIWTYIFLFWYIFDIIKNTVRWL